MITAAIVNVRMGSSRLPGKALRMISGKPLLEHLLDRLQLAKTIDDIVVSTSTLVVNDAIASFCAVRGVYCFRGAEDDVLARTLGALRSVGAQRGVVVFGDGPLIDPAIIDHVVDAYATADPPYDFVSNDLKTSYPPGMEVEVFGVAALADADRRCSDTDMREHGTLFIRRNPELYRLRNMEAPLGLRRPDLELEVDTESDLQVVGAVLSNFQGRTDFTLDEVIGFLDAHPQIAAINRDVPRHWKAARSDG